MVNWWWFDGEWMVIWWWINAKWMVMECCIHGDSVVNQCLFNSVVLCSYIYIYVCIYNCIYIYMYIYLFKLWFNQQTWWYMIWRNIMYHVLALEFPWSQFSVCAGPYATKKIQKSCLVPRLLNIPKLRHRAWANRWEFFTIVPRPSGTISRRFVVGPRMTKAVSETQSCEATLGGTIGLPTQTLRAWTQHWAPVHVPSNGKLGVIACV